MNFNEYLNLRNRSPKQVFEDHLRLRQEGKLEDDLKTNFSNGVEVKTNFGDFHGKNGVRKCAGILKKQLPCHHYVYKKKTVNGNMAELWWSGQCGRTKVDDGYDVFTIENGKIVKQVIFYTVKKG